MSDDKPAWDWKQLAPVAARLLGKRRIMFTSHSVWAILVYFMKRGAVNHALKDPAALNEDLWRRMVITQIVSSWCWIYVLFRVEDRNTPLYVIYAIAIGFSNAYFLIMSPIDKPLAGYYYSIGIYTGAIAVVMSLVIGIKFEVLRWRRNHASAPAGSEAEN